MAEVVARPFGLNTPVCPIMWLAAATGGSGSLGIRRIMPDLRSHWSVSSDDTTWAGKGRGLGGVTNQAKEDMSKNLNLILLAPYNLFAKLKHPAW